MVTKELPLTEPVGRKMKKVSAKKTEWLKEKFLQQFTETVVSHLVGFKNISDINHNSLIILKNTLNPYTEQNIFSNILGFDLKRINPKNAIQERIVAADFLIEGVGNILTEISNKENLTGTESSILINFRRFQPSDKNHDTVNVIRGMLRQHFSTCVPTNRKGMAQRNSYCGPRSKK